MGRTISRTAGACSASTSKLLSALDEEGDAGDERREKEGVEEETDASSTVGGGGGGGSMGVCASSVRTCWIFQRSEGPDMVVVVWGLRGGVRRRGV